MKSFNLCLLSALLCCLGCKPKQGDDAAGQGNSTVPASSRVELVDGVTEVYFTGNDRMRFSLTEFTVKTGQPVRIIFENTGNMPKATMGHNVVILKQGVNANAYATTASKVSDADFIPQTEADSVIAHTKLLGPGEKDTIEFVAPAPGDYVYLCTFPAHCFAGMRGVMRVE
ncbi:MAG: plastocyanin/azurin family copper-binding protein [Opitutaceae bacterium]